jgi:hypothetical protein
MRSRRSRRICTDVKREIDDIERRPGTGALPRWLIKARALRTSESGSEGADAMKGIVLRTAVVLLGTLAYVGVGIALANAG